MIDRPAARHGALLLLLSLGMMFLVHAPYPKPMDDGAGPGSGTIGPEPRALPRFQAL